ncbi:hypothetical protein E4N76_08100 [Treponema putidum]|uniref:Uncharacterized protein n=2 Tax=Treponema TaxID=157 RepID=Q73NG0_TREDE|nr:hypothetical protein TDE_0579 [Treponema denticola ATCC 35405]AAS11711.1 hypothetical protein TDE_1193 [Treponema denticola ATCC 35405]UTY28947.1 hypothetical protein E4N76_08100 [Treponema putidum]
MLRNLVKANQLNPYRFLILSLPKALRFGYFCSFPSLLISNIIR